jgi:hypothetical protein
MKQALPVHAKAACASLASLPGLAALVSRHQGLLQIVVPADVSGAVGQ